MGRSFVYALQAILRPSRETARAPKEAAGPKECGLRLGAIGETRMPRGGGLRRDEARITTGMARSGPTPVRIRGKAVPAVPWQGRPAFRTAAHGIAQAKAGPFPPWPIGRKALAQTARALPPRNGVPASHGLGRPAAGAGARSRREWRCGRGGPPARNGRPGGFPCHRDATPVLGRRLRRTLLHRLDRAASRGSPENRDRDRGFS